jgi:hypothetical protein
MFIPDADTHSLRPAGIGARHADDEEPIYTRTDMIEEMLPGDATRKHRT